MILAQILSSNLTDWEEGVIAAVFLNALSENDLAIEIVTAERVKAGLAILNDLPWGYAKEVCYEVMRREDVAGSECKSIKRSL